MRSGSHVLTQMATSGDAPEGRDATSPCGPSTACSTWSVLKTASTTRSHSRAISSAERAARAERSDALAAGALNLATDIGTALVALVSHTFVRFGVERADAVGGLLVAAFVAFAALRLGKRSADVLMDRAPRFPVEKIEAAAAAASGVSEARRVRVRGTPKQLFADVGFPLMPPAQIADAVVHAVTSGETGRCYVCQPGREPLAYEFRDLDITRNRTRNLFPDQENAGQGTDHLAQQTINRTKDLGMFAQEELLINEALLLTAGVIAVALGRSKLGFLGIALALAAQWLGGVNVQVGEFDQPVISFGLDWLVPEVWGRRA